MLTINDLNTKVEGMSHAEKLEVIYNLVLDNQLSLPTFKQVLDQPTNDLINFPRYIKDGKIGFLFSRNGGWSTWNKDKFKSILTTHRDIVDAVLKKKSDDEIVRITETVISEACNGDVDVSRLFTGGVDGLKVEWVDTTASIVVENHDGSESFKSDF